MRGKKGTRWNESSPDKKKELSMRVDCKGNMNKSNTQNSPPKEPCEHIY